MELADGTSAPADVHPERHHAVHEVVARTDPVEQRSDGRRLALPRRQRRIGHGSNLRSASSSTTRRKWLAINAVTAGKKASNAPAGPAPPPPAPPPRSPGRFPNGGAEKTNPRTPH